MIRKAVTADLGEVYDLIQKNLEEVNSKDYPKHVIQFMKTYYSREHLEKWLAERRFFLVYIDRDEILGTVMLDGSEVKGLYVKVKAQGQGVGKKLMNALESLLDDEEVCLYASLTAYSFYRALGYATEKKVDDEAMGQAYLMTKRIKKG